MADKQETLNYTSLPQPSRRWPFLRISILAAAFGILCATASVIGVNGQHDPSLWFDMLPSEHWRGYLGMGARATTPWLALLTFAAILFDVVLFIVHDRRKQTARGARTVRIMLLIVAAIGLMFPLAAPGFDL